MNEQHILTILNEQTQLLNQILYRLERLESYSEISRPIEQSSELNGTKAIAHLKSLGISW